MAVDSKLEISSLEIRGQYRDIYLIDKDSLNFLAYTIKKAKRSPLAKDIMCTYRVRISFASGKYMDLSSWCPHLDCGGMNFGIIEPGLMDDEIIYGVRFDKTAPKKLQEIFEMLKKDVRPSKDNESAGAS